SWINLGGRRKHGSAAMKAIAHSIAGKSACMGLLSPGSMQAWPINSTSHQSCKSGGECRRLVRRIPAMKRAPMKLNQSYKLIRFLNRRHSLLSRYSCATIGWLGGLATTRSLVLANALFMDFAADSYTLAFRKATRHARQALRADIFKDPFFDFTMGTHDAERRALEQRLQHTQHRVPESEHLTDLLYIRAADIHHLLEQKKPAQATIDEFYCLANQALRGIPPDKPKTARKHKVEANTSGFDKAMATAALWDFANLLPMQEWPWFVISGTFLGLHRENSFLPHDYDIDLGINAEAIDIDELAQVLDEGKHFIIKNMGYHLQVLRNEKNERYLN